MEIQMFLSYENKNISLLVEISGYLLEKVILHCWNLEKQNNIPF